VALVALAVGLLTLYSWFIPEPGPNELSRLDLVYALVKQRTTSIDAYAANTIDRALFEGRYYSDKPIGLPLLAAPVFFLADRLLGLGDLGATRVSYVAQLLTSAVVSLPAALLAPLVALTARRLGAAPATAIAAAVAMAIATALLPFAGVFYAHATSAALGFAAFAFASGALLPTRRVAAAALAGLCAGLAALVEYPVILVGAALLPLWMARTGGQGGSPRGERPRPAPRMAPALAYLGAAALTLLPLPIYNWLSFGAPWRLGYSFVDPLAFGGMSTGFFGLATPSLAALAEITIGSAGLLTQSPFLLLAPLGLMRWRTPAAWCAASIPILFLLYNASYYLPMGGQSSGPRFLVPALPFLALLLAFAPRAAWLAAAPLALYGFVHVLAIAAVEPKTGPGHPNALLDYWLPRLVAGDLALSWSELRFGLTGAAALAPMVVPLAVVLAAAVAAAHSAPRWLGAALLAVAVLQWAALAAPIGRGGVPARFGKELSTASQRSVDVVYGGDLALVGVRAPVEVSPGGTLDLDLIWRTLRPVDENLVAFVHAVGPDGESLGGRDLPPAGPGFPTNLWRPGEIVRTPFRFRVAESAETPIALTVIVGLYPPGGRPLSARLPDGSEVVGGPPVARLALRRHAPEIASAPRVAFEGGLELADLRLPPTARAGAPARITLVWRARTQPARDASVFVQALGSGGVVAQWDAQPRRGRYPTSLWPIGEVVEDEMQLTVPVAGEYRLIGGLYLLPEVRRLGVVGGGDFVELGTLRVEP
jgi:hypothetical protein